MSEDATTEPGQPSGQIIIEWPPAPSEPRCARLVITRLIAIYEVMPDGQERLLPFTSLAIRTEPDEIVTAELGVLVDADRNRLYANGKPVERDGELLTGTFTFHVAAIRIRQ